MPEVLPAFVAAEYGGLLPSRAMMQMVRRPDRYQRWCMSKLASDLRYTEMMLTSAGAYISVRSSDAKYVDRVEGKIAHGRGGDD